ncbi:hypothetical protein D3C80_850820 [compost metagenome]
MVHEVTADLIGGVGDAVRIFLRSRDQQKLGALDAVGGEHEILCRQPMLGIVRLLVPDRHDLTVVIGLDPVDRRIVEQLGAMALRLVDMHRPVIFGADRTDRIAIVVAGADWAIAIGARGAAMRFEHRIEAADRKLFRQRVEHVAGVELLHRERHRARRHRSATLAAFVLAVGAGDAKFQFGLVVILLQIVVADRPVPAAAVERLELEIVGDHPPQC